MNLGANSSSLAREGRGRMIRKGPIGWYRMVVLGNVTGASLGCGVNAHSILGFL